MTWARLSFVSGVVGSAMLSLVCLRADAQTIKTTTAPRLVSVEGVDSFKAYCAACHGAKAKGDGPAAMALKKAPADLTGIARRHDGKFSAAEVEDMILGRSMSASHGTREMPIWGPVFEAVAPDPSFAKLRVANLVAYLKSIQTQ